MTLRATFSRIYRDNAWNGVESLSGPGSGDAATRRIREAIAQLVEDLGALSVLDVACGDGYWMPDVPGYLGIDVAPPAIARAQTLHPARAYRVADIRDGTWPAFDLVICRDAIQHLPLDDGVAVLEAIRRTRSRALLVSTYIDGENVDVGVGGAFRPDLTRPPFDLPQPERLICDGYAYETPELVRDPGKHLGLWQLR